MRVGMLTSGGDCQSLNATMRGVAKTLYNQRKDVEIIGFIEGFIIFLNIFFFTEEFHHADSGETILYEGGDSGLAFLHHLGFFVDDVAHFVDPKRENRQGHQSPKRHLYICHKHINARDDQQNNKIDDIHHAGTKIHPDGNNIFTETVHQISDSGFFIIRYR